MSGSKKKAERRVNLAEMGMTEKQKQELKAQQTKRRNAILAAIGGAVAVILVIALLVWHSGFIPRHTTALTVKDHKFSVADMDYFYHQALNTAYSNEQYMAQLYDQYGMEYEVSFDPSADLTTQYVDEEKTQSYHDYFMNQAKENVTQLCALYDAAKAAGHNLSEDAQKQVDTAMTDLDTQIAQYNIASRSAYLKAVYGRNMTEKVYLKNLGMNVLASDYYSAASEQTAEYSDEELEAYYKEHTTELDSYAYEYVYFDGTPSTEGEGDEAAEPTDADKANAMAAAKSQAERMLEAVKSAAEDQSFSDVAASLTYTATPRSGVMGTSLTTSIYGEWMMDDARKAGDTEMFELTDSGYYVVQFSGRERDDSTTVDVRHILTSFKADEDAEHEHDENGTHVYTDAEKAAANETAQSILNEYLAGEQTAEAFGALAEKYSDDGRDNEGNLNAPGGLYEAVYQGQMVKPFEEWCFANHEVGDTGMVETTYGWRVMYYQGLHRAAWKDQAANDKKGADMEAFMDKIEEGYEAVEESGWAQVGKA